MILSWIKDSQDRSIVSIPQSIVVDLVKERALELEKHEWVEDPWGGSETQARRADAAELRR